MCAIFSLVICVGIFYFGCNLQTFVNKIQIYYPVYLQNFNLIYAVSYPFLSLVNFDDSRCYQAWPYISYFEEIRKKLIGQG